MPGFTLKIDVSQFQSGAKAAGQTAAELGRQMRIVANDANKLADSLEGVNVAPLKKNLRGVSGEVDQLTRKIGDYAKQIVALVAAYKALGAVGSFVKRGMEFNASLEASEIAIASVIAATNKLSDAQGRTLEGAEKFNAAQQLSKGMMDEIQVLALQTTATFDSLADGVAGVVAPATKFGVSMEKLPGFAVRAAQAMATMKIPVQQMRTEIEALLSGNINRAQDILATNLGITGEMVRNWQKQGTLVDELNKRFEAFAIAGDKVADSWSGLRGNMEDALNYLSGKTGRGIFEGAKQSYRELLQLMVSTDGKVGVGKDIENIVTMVEDLQSAIGDELIEVTRSFIDTIKDLNKPETLEKFASTLDNIFNVTGDIAGHVGTVASAVADFISSSLSGWNSMPDIIKELGIFGAIALGAKGKLALAAVGVAIDKLEGVYDWMLEKGWINPVAAPQFKGNNATAETPVTDALKAQTAKRAVVQNSFDVLGGLASSNSVTVSPSISGNSKNTPEQIASAKEKLAQLTFEIKKMNGEANSNTLSQKLAQIDKAATVAGVNAAKLKEEYAAAFKADTLEAFDKALLKAGNNTRAIADLQIAETVEQWKLKLLDAKVPLEEATQKAKELEEALKAKAAQDEMAQNASLLKEIGELTGDVAMSTEAQNQLLEAQAQAFKARLNPEMHSFIDKWLELKKLQNSREGWSGAYRAAQDYFDSASNMAESFYDITTNAFSGMEDAIVTACQTGKLSFSDMINSMISDLIRLMVRQSITGPLANALQQGIAGIFTGGASTASVNASSYSFTSSAGSSLAYTPTGIGHDGWELVGSTRPSNGYRSVPTELFANAPRFHSGTGYVRPGEYPAILKAGERVLNPSETRAYQRGEPSVNINIVNSTGQQTATKTRSDNHGNKTIDVYVGDMAAKQMATPGTTLNRAVNAQTGTRRPAIKR